LTQTTNNHNDIHYNPKGKKDGQPERKRDIMQKREKKKRKKKIDR
jgi:hypothetical protein